MNVAFLVIGGQARHFHSEAKTHDLDIWIDHNEENLRYYCAFHTQWAQRYPNHIHRNARQPCHSDIQKNTQIVIPDADVVVELGNHDIPLNEHNKIDVLFHLDGFDFVECQRHACVDTNGYSFLSEKHLKQTAIKRHWT